VGKNKDKDGVWLTTYVPIEVKRRFRVACAKEDISMSAKIAQLIERDLKRRKM
jgi:hypothetical protein